MINSDEFCGSIGIPSLTCTQGLPCYGLPIIPGPVSKKSAGSVLVWALVKILRWQRRNAVVAWENREWLICSKVISQNGGTPIAGWFISWKILWKMDENWGYPYFRKPPYSLFVAFWWNISIVWLFHSIMGFTWPCLIVRVKGLWKGQVSASYETRIPLGNHAFWAFLPPAHPRPSQVSAWANTKSQSQLPENHEPIAETDADEWIIGKFSTGGCRQPPFRCFTFRQCACRNA